MSFRKEASNTKPQNASSPILSMGRRRLSHDKTHHLKTLESKVSTHTLNSPKATQRKRIPTPRGRSKSKKDQDLHTGNYYHAFGESQTLGKIETSGRKSLTGPTNADSPFKKNAVLRDDPYVADEGTGEPLRIVAQKRYAKQMVFCGSAIRVSPRVRRKNSIGADATGLRSSALGATASGGSMNKASVLSNSNPSTQQHGNKSDKNSSVTAAWTQTGRKQSGSGK